MDFNDISFSPNGKFLALATSNHTIELWNFELRVSIGSIKGVSYKSNLPNVIHTAWAPNSQFFAVATNGNYCTVYNRRLEIVQSIKVKNNIHGIQFSPNGLFLGLSTKNKYLLFDFQEKKYLKTLRICSSFKKTNLENPIPFVF